MKPKFTPGICYILGLWKHLRTEEGVGIRGNEALQEAFVQVVLAEGLNSPERFQVKGKEIFFYHSKLRRFLERLLEKRLQRFKYRNDYSASYFAGQFDAVGHLPAILPRDLLDQAVLQNLGFKVEERGKRMLVSPPGVFLSFLLPFLRVKAEVVKEILSGPPLLGHLRKP